MTHFAHWVITVTNGHADRVHDIFHSAAFFHDRETAHGEAVHRLANFTSKHEEKKDAAAEKVKGSEKPETPVLPAAATVAPKAEEEEEFNLDDGFEEECEENNEEIIPPPGSQDEADVEAMGESEENILSWMPDNKFKPVNVLDQDKQDSAFADPEKAVKDTVEKITVPAELKTALKDLLKDLGEEWKNAVIHDRNSSAYYPGTMEFVAGLLDLLNQSTPESIKTAQLKIAGVGGHILHRIPDKVIKFIVRGGEPRTLKDIFYTVKEK